MTHTAINPAQSVSVLTLLAAPFTAIGRGLIRLAETNSRAKEVRFLKSLSDAELANRGIMREDIVRHVYNDTFYL